MGDKKSPERWQNEAMRLGGEALVEKIFEIADNQKEMLNMMDKFDDRHRDAEIAIQNLYKAIPGSDVDGHRRAHEAFMEDILTKKRLVEAIREKTISGLVWAFIVMAAGALWLSIKTQLGFPPK